MEWRRRILPILATFLLVGSGGHQFLTGRSWWGRATAVLVASLGALAPALLILGMLGVMD